LWKPPAFSKEKTVKPSWSALASPRHPEQVVDLEAVRQDRKLVDFLRDVVAAIEAADQGAGSR
jgi:hypothetical protein